MRPGDGDVDGDKTGIDREQKSQRGHFQCATGPQASERPPESHAAQPANDDAEYLPGEQVLAEQAGGEHQQPAQQGAVNAVSADELERFQEMDDPHQRPVIEMDPQLRKHQPVAGEADG